MPNTTTVSTRCHECGQRLSGGSLVESLRAQLREAKLGMKQRDGEIERLTALLIERGLEVDRLHIRAEADHLRAMMREVEQSSNQEPADG